MYRFQLIHFFKLCCILWLCIGFSSVLAQGTQRVSFTSGRWVVPEGTIFKVERHLGQECVYLDGYAYLKDAYLKDGIIEVDIAPNTTRSFAGLTFRGQSDGNYEEAYLRMHKSGLPDALQYNPFYNGEANWQLYPQHQAAEEFNTTQWNHLKLVINGTRLEVYVNDQMQPGLLVENLRHDYVAGTVGIYALLGNRFANFRYTPQTISNPASAPIIEPVPGTVMQWQLSPAFPIQQMGDTTYPKTDQLTWETVATEADGLLPISKYRKKASSGNFDANSEDIVWIKLSVQANRKMEKKFYFDYSDRVQVYLNRNPVFAGNNAFRFKGLLFRGDIGVEGNALYLDLQRGQNELLFAIMERANGWGLIGRWEDLQGIQLKYP